TLPVPPSPVQRPNHVSSFSDSVTHAQISSRGAVNSRTSTSSSPSPVVRRKPVPSAIVVLSHVLSSTPTLATRGAPRTLVASGPAADGRTDLPRPARPAPRRLP